MANPPGPRNVRSPLRLEDLLLRHGAITPEQLRAAQEEQKKWGGDVGRAFVELGFISEELLMRAYAHQLGIPFLDPATMPLDPAVVNLLSVHMCESLGVIPVARDLKRKVVQFATSDPNSPQIRGPIAQATGYVVELATATSDSITRAIRKNFYGDEPGSASDVLLIDTADIVEEPEPRTPAGSLEQRLLALEELLVKTREELASSMTSNPQMAGVLARLELLEQLSTNDIGQLRAVVELLIERKVFTREELAAKRRTLK
jgi:hypothetical protein